MDLVIILIALCAAPYMLARMLKLPSPPTPRTIWLAVAPTIKPTLAIVGYFCKRALAYQWQPEEHEIPAWLRGEVSSVFVTSSGKNSADAQTDADGRYVSRLYEAAERLELDVSRRNTIDILVLAGGDIPKIRSIIKGDNSTIGIEVAEARERLGVTAPTRTIIARQHIDGRLEEKELAL